MKDRKKIKKISKATRRYRRIHHYLGITLLLLLFISATTGILLAWKKNVDLLQPPTQRGDSPSLQTWKPLDELQKIATTEISNHVDDIVSVDRMDVRPEKGIVKVLYKPGYWEVQLDGTSGEVLSVEKRYSDLIEQIHDGSIINDAFKLISMNVLGIGLILLMLSGFWLWYGPRLIRYIKRKSIN